MLLCPFLDYFSTALSSLVVIGWPTSRFLAHRKCTKALTSHFDQIVPAFLSDIGANPWYVIFFFVPMHFGFSWPGPMGSEARFANHSCSPNCSLKKWSVLGETRVVLVAAQEISPGEVFMPNKIGEINSREP